MHLKVSPDLPTIVAAAQEAKIAIDDLEFIRNAHCDVIEALNIEITGPQSALDYFSWLLNRANVRLDCIRP